jgi:negative regulator of genetic competence, sporulation and motility
MDALREAAEKLDTLGVEKQKSALYLSEDGSYLLVLPLAERENGRTPSPYSFLNEYGRREKNDFFLAYIKEYGTTVYPDDAIARLLREKENFSV